MSEPRSPLEISIKRLIRLSIALYVVVALVVLGLGGVVVYATNQASQTEDALCTLRSDLSKRVAASQQFLTDHPEGIPGIPRNVILDGIRNQRRTIDALSDLNC